MTIRLQILTKSARTHLKLADHEACAAFFASHRCWRETQEKGTDSKLTCQGEKGGQTQNLTMASPRYCVFLVRKAAMEGSWFFFTPLGNVIFHTALAVFKWWQTGHNKCDTWKAWLRSFFFSSWRICQRQYECMIAAAAERPIWHSVCITARLPWNCPEVAMWWPLAKTQTRWLKGNTSKSDSVNLLLWHACTERAPDYP